jgi:DNA mismatch endonuclease (patch repair protein)
MPVSRAGRSRIMKSIKSKDTEPEMAVRRILRKLGYRYQLHRANLPGKPDLVFGRRKKVIFVHGCFWHMHLAASCSNGRYPKTNTRYWRSKLNRNMERDRSNISNLKKRGWRVAVVWECQVAKEAQLAARLKRFLDG